jgi:Uma2 family endonuclease
MIVFMEQPIPQPPAGRITEDEYLRLEEAARTRHEFRGGQIVDMAGGTLEHAGIAASIITELTVRLKGKPCKAYGSDLAVRINSIGNYFYPDVSVLCDPPIYAVPDKRTAVTNPKIVFEVTSRDSEADDRGDKFTDYRWIESLEEYILVSQQRAQVETFYRQGDGIWAIGPTFAGLDASVKLRSVSIEIPLSEIYAGITFSPAQTEPKRGTP